MPWQGNASECGESLTESDQRLVENWSGVASRTLDLRSALYLRRLPRKLIWVLLSGERTKREQADQAKLISGLRELLAMAENGEIKAVCYAAIDCNNDNVTLGVLRGEDIGLHEMIGLAHILSDALLETLRD